MKLADIPNDNEEYASVDRGPDPDAHGQAALLLVEGLIHGLIDRSVISVADAVEIVEIAAETKADLAADLGYAPETPNRSLDLISAIGKSLKTDM